MNLKSKITPASQYFIFWSWNLIFVFLIAFLLTEHIIIPVITSMVKGSTPIEQGLFALSLFVTPFIAIGLGISKGFRKNPARLLQLFFGIELPLFFLAFTRLFITSELTAATTYLLLLAILGIGAYTFQLFSQHIKKSPRRHLIELGSLHFSLIFGVYIGILLLFISIPLLTIGVVGFFSSEWLDILSKAPLSILFALFFIYTLTLFAGLPLMLCVLYTKQFWQKYKLTAPLYKKKLVLSIVITVLALNVGILYFTNIQDQAEALALLSKPVENKQDKLQLLKRQELIRSGLLNAYLRNARYTGTIMDNRMIADLYHEAFGLDRYARDSIVQTAFNFVATPFLFDNSGKYYSAEQIANFYSNFFDASIEKAERKTIRSALRSDWRRVGFAAGLIDADQEKVWIENQIISIMESRHSALITIQETYYNQTFQRQEIVYHFSLPAEAALTGIWLSDDKQNLKKYAYTVSPRGAAQKLYKQEVQRRIDPALLEQVGPYQYRLRIFPILPKQSESPFTFKTTAKPMYMKMQYVVPLTETRKWAMPTLLEKQNAFWSDETKLSLNDVVAHRPNDAWLPEDPDAIQATPLQSQIVVLTTQSDQPYTININTQQGLIPSHTQKNFAILIDTSYSMRKNRNKLDRVLNNLAKHTTTSSTKIDYFLVGKTLTLTENPQAQELLFFGNTGHLSHLDAWQKYKPATRYDALVIVTDEGSYELAEKIKLKTDLLMPIWLMHIGDQLPYAYDDKLLDYIMKTNGGISTNFASILQQTEQTNPDIRISGQFQWLFKEGGTDETTPSDPQLVQLAARQYINHYYRKHKSTGLKTLDQLHRIAIQHSIITPFSSMIVLVNDGQKERLKKLSEQDNRFDRDIEQARVIANNNLFEASGVPEPEEWALIIVICIMLLSAYIRRRNNFIA